jgi:hypothetical protein
VKLEGGQIYVRAVRVVQWRLSFLFVAPPLLLRTLLPPFSPSEPFERLHFILRLPNALHL